MRRVLSVLLALCLLVGVVPMAAMPSQAAALTSGKCGDTVTWDIASDGTLTIRGTGSMYDYETSYDQRPPWITSTNQTISRVVFESGVTRIGKFAFYQHSLNEVIIPSTIKEIGDYAFYNCFQLKTAKVYADISELPGGIFFNCFKLERLYLSASIDTLRRACLRNCYNLLHIYTYGSWEGIAIEVGADVNDGGNAEKPTALTQAKRHTLTGTPSDDYSLPPSSSSTPAPSPTPTSSPSPSPSPAPENTATVVYEPNGGSGYMAPQTVEAGKRYTLPACAFTPPAGKEFECWQGSSGLHWNPGDTPVAAVSPGMTITYTARWKDKTSSTVGGFTDVKESDYFSAAVVWAVEKGITGGTSSTTFSPGEGCTRAQIMTFIWASRGRPSATTEASFSDMPSLEAYRKAISWAVEKGITGGVGNNQFGPNRPCTRVQAVTFLWIAAGRPAPAKTADFSDMPSNPVFRDAISWAVEKGITGGTGDNRFSPNKTCTRAQIVTLLKAAEGK